MTWVNKYGLKKVILRVNQINIYDYKYKESISMLTNKNYFCPPTHNSHLSQPESLQQWCCLSKEPDSLYPGIFPLYIDTYHPLFFSQHPPFLPSVLLIANHLVIQASQQDCKASEETEKTGWGEKTGNLGA